MPGREFWTQLYALGIGLVALLVCLTIDYRMLAEHSLLIYGGLLGAARLRAGHGRSADGRAALDSVGPSTFSRPSSRGSALALMLAMFFGENRRGARNTGDLALGGIFIAHPVPPDRQAAGPRHGDDAAAGLPRHRLPRRPAAAAARRSPSAWPSCWRRSPGSSGSRTTRSRASSTFLDPEQDPRGAGYQPIQARITVGSGGLTGKGFLQGTQGQYKFLPVAHNDFIFSVLAEEHGFLGVLTTLGLYLFVILQSLEAARLAKDRIGAYLVGGIISGFAFQVIYNITMSAGLAPVKGLTLPLMSYGGSSLIATLAGFGLILNVRMRRFTN